MDFENSDNLSEPQEPQQQLPPDISPLGPEPQKEAKKSRSGWRIFWGIILTLSVLANIALVMMLIGVTVFFAATARPDAFNEEVIQRGDKANKIAVITVSGVIGDELSQQVHEQFKSARKDKQVKGVIVRVNSPGGCVAASDQIHNEITQYRVKTKKPVVAFMQSVAASGGYYSSVACDVIMAEPTVITGSIGVIMGHFVLQQLLEEKLGIEPVVVKSGEKKDWPSPFRPVTEEQKQYIQDKLINPAYERFVELVDDGRKDLRLADVRRLADGSIYGAEEAMEEKLIDEIGYLEDAITLAADLAKIERPHVIEYIKPFSFADVLGARAKSFFRLDKKMLYELSTPQLMYLWTVQQ